MKIYRLQENEKMGMLEFLILAAGLSMDAFAVSICKGMFLQKMNWNRAVTAGLYFGGFQAVMPFIGYLIGWKLKDMVIRVDHWIAFLVLTFIGAGMIKEAKAKVKKMDAAFDFKTMFPLAIATNADALAVGVSFACLNVRIVQAAVWIGMTGFVLSVAGIWIGTVFGTRYKTYAEFAGGIVVILMGAKILLEHIVLR